MKRGSVGVLVRDGRFLVICRSQQVTAPGCYCFPGGKIEPGETELAALRREICEELGTPVAWERFIWRSVTPWRVSLSWWQVGVDDPDKIVPNDAEVASIHWLTAEEMLALPKLLSSNREFLEAVARGDVRLEAASS